MANCFNGARWASATMPMNQQLPLGRHALRGGKALHEDLRLRR